MFSRLSYLVRQIDEEGDWEDISSHTISFNTLIFDQHGGNINP